jgi:hypothetical protein
MQFDSHAFVMTYISTEENWGWRKTVSTSLNIHPRGNGGKVSGISPVRDSCEILGSCATIDQAAAAEVSHSKWLFVQRDRSQ